MNPKGRDVKWDPDEITKLRSLYAASSIASIAQRLGRTCAAVTQKAASLGLSSTRKANIDWTAEKDQLLQSLYQENTARQIANQLGLHVFNVKSRVKRLGLKKSDPTTPRNRQGTQSCTQWTTADDQLIRDHYRTTPSRTLAAQLKRSVSALHMRAHKLNISKEKKPIPIGGERVNSKGLLLRKISNTGNQHRDYKRVDVIEWERRNGPLPKGMILVVVNPYLPRTPENMQPMTAQQLTARISGQETCPELKELFLLKRQLMKSLKPALKKPKQDFASS